MPEAVVYDAGALLAAERDDRRFMALQVRLVERESRLLVPAPVLTQVWRGGRRQVTLSRTLRACEVIVTTEAVARFAGVLLARSRTSDAVDAIVVATALAERAAVVATNDPKDLDLLLGDPAIRVKPRLLVV
jgi:predicted nucleic acid-binding protein